MICDTSNSNLTLSVPGSKPTYPDCPDTSQQHCAIQLHVDSTKPCLSLPISSFTSPFGLCVGKSDGTRNWTSPIEAIDKVFFGGFGWADYRGQKWSAYLMSQGLIQIGIVAGTVPSAGSDQFQVKYARLWPLDPDPLDYLASGSSGPPGSPGGPLLFNFQRDPCGASSSARASPEPTEGPPDEVRAGLRSLFEDIPDAEA